MASLLVNHGRDVPEEKREVFNALREPMIKLFEK